MPFPLSKIKRLGEYDGQWWPNARCRCCRDKRCRCEDRNVEILVGVPR